jgi:hypothetical protein
MLKFFQFITLKFLSKLYHYSLIVVTFIIIFTIPINCLVGQNLDSLSQISYNNSAELKFDLFHEASNLF